MKKHKSRQSERVSVALSIQVQGTDLFGDVFLYEGQTELVSREGAQILLRQKLSQDQEIIVRCLESGKESGARVMERINGKKKQNSYGIVLLGSEESLWGFSFPPKGDSAAAVGRTILECTACHKKELAYLDGFELEVLESNRVLPRYCRKCRGSTTWKNPFDQDPDTTEPSSSIPELYADTNPPSSAPSPGKIQEQRRETRLGLRTTACIRSPKFGEQLVKVRNVSRSGLCYESHDAYQEGWEIESAIPYSTGGGNVFMPAQIVRVQPLTHENLYLCGVAYVRDNYR